MMRPRVGAPPEHDYPHVPIWIVWALCVYLVAWYLQLGVRRPILGAFRFEFVLASSLVALVFYRWVSGMGRGARGQAVIVWASLLFAVLGMHVVFSIFVDESWRVFNERVIQLAFIGAFVATFVKSPNHLRWVIAALFFAWLKLGQEGLVGHLSGGMIWQNQGIMRLHGSTTMFGHPNSFAGLALGTLPFVYYLYGVVENRWLKRLLILQAIFSIHILIYTGSRTGYVGFAGLLLYIAWRSPKRVKALAAIVSLMLIAALVVPDEYKGRAVSIFTLEEVEGDSSGKRMEIMRDAWEILMDNPLGVGVGAFPYARFERFGRLQDTHNLYLQVATNIGFHGLIVFLAFVLSMLRSLARTRRDAEELLERAPPDLDDVDPIESPARLRAWRSDLPLIVAMTKAIEAFIICRLLLGMFGMDLYEIYWWLGLGFTVALRNLVFHAERIVEDPEPRRA